MPDKNFEKNVQEKLGDFNLAPTNKVWMHVEEELHKKSKRRRGIVWFFVGTIALIGSVYMLSLPAGNLSDNSNSLTSTAPAVVPASPSPGIENTPPDSESKKISSTEKKIAVN